MKYKFKTELGIVFEICQCANDEERLDAFLTSKTERMVNVCKAIEEMKKESLAEGIEQGGLRMLMY